MKEIPSAKSLMPETHEIDRTAKDKTRGITGDMVAAAEAQMRSKNILTPQLSHHKQNKNKSDDLPPVSNFIG